MLRQMDRVVIIGAGPYGLAAAAHLRPTGVQLLVFGEAMAFWERQMPQGMLLRSPWVASHISSPGNAFSLSAYENAQGAKLPNHIPLERFIDYGRWVQRQAVPDLDSRRVASVEKATRGFAVELDDGEVVEADRVVVAGGIAPFAHRPPEYRGLPATLVSHASEHGNLAEFAGQCVVVVGGGQSAIETAVLLAECGAGVEVIMRAPRVRWLRRRGWLHQHGGWVKRLLYAPSDVGPAGLSRLVAAPDLFRRLPRHLQERWAYRSIRPAASSWLLPRSGEVRITAGRHVVAAREDGECAELSLDDGSSRSVDHVILATGYRVEVSRYPYLGPHLLQGLRCVGGYPVLSAGFESSQPGLHFLGAPAAWSFGPLMRFVAGTEYTGPALARRIRAQRA